MRRSFTLKNVNKFNDLRNKEGDTVAARPIAFGHHGVEGSNRKRTDERCGADIVGQCPTDPVSVRIGRWIVNSRTTSGSVRLTR